MAEIRVQISLGYYPDSHVDRFLAINIDKFMQCHYTPLDFPSLDAGAVSLLCSRPTDIEMQLNNRRGLAKYITAEMTDFILASIAGEDTEMGYKKNDQ